MVKNCSLMCTKLQVVKKLLQGNKNVIPLIDILFKRLCDKPLFLLWLFLQWRMRNVLLENKLYILFIILKGNEHKNLVCLIWKNLQNEVWWYFSSLPSATFSVRTRAVYIAWQQNYETAEKIMLSHFEDRSSFKREKYFCCYFLSSTFMFRKMMACIFQFYISFCCLIWGSD